MSKKSSLIVLFFLILIGILGRVFPHIPNVTPVTAIALFAVTYFGFRYSFVILLLTMVITDFFIGFYQWQIILAVYGSFILAGIVGLFIRRHKTTIVIFSGTLVASVVFFLVTNFAVWQFGNMYVHSWPGLVECYTMALPFFRNSLIGDLFYTGAFFGLFESAQYFILRQAKTVAVKY